MRMNLRTALIVAVALIAVTITTVKFVKHRNASLPVQAAASASSSEPKKELATRPAPEEKEDRSSLAGRDEARRRAMAKRWGEPVLVRGRFSVVAMETDELDIFTHRKINAIGGPNCKVQILTMDEPSTISAPVSPPVR